MAKATKGSFMNAILEQKKQAEPEAPARRGRAAAADGQDASFTRHARNTQNTSNTDDTYDTYNTQNAENTQNTLNTPIAQDTHTAPNTADAQAAPPPRRRRQLTRLNLALDSALLLDMEDLAIVRGKKSLTALLTDVMAAEVAKSRDKIEAYRKIKG